MWDVLALFPRFNNAKSQDGNALTFFVRCSRKKVPVLSFERKDINDIDLLFETNGHVLHRICVKVSRYK